MADIMTPQTRSKFMARIQGKDTAPEMVVRRLVHAMGWRYRLHCKDLIGKPDLVFPRLRKAVFVHGCYWHRHPGCKDAAVPKTRADFWARKFASNVARDRKATEELEKAGWQVMVVWECETNKKEKLTNRLRDFLSDE